MSDPAPAEASPSPATAHPASVDEDAIEVRGRLTVDDLVRHTWYRRLHDQLLLTALLAIAVFLAPLVIWYTDRGIAFHWAVLIGLAAVALSMAINHWQFRRFARRTVQRLEPVGDVQVRLSSHGIEQRTQASTGTIAWSSVEKIVRTPHAIYLDLGGVTHVLPKRFFGDADLPDVEARLRAWWKPNAAASTF